MSDTIEHAREGIHEAHHAHALHGDTTARRIAVLIAVLAAALALAEMGEKGAQNEYLTQHVAVADGWAFYQAKNLRAAVLAARGRHPGESAECRRTRPAGGDQACARDRGTHARRTPG